MDTLAKTLESAMLSRQAIGVVLAIAAITMLRANREFVREVWRDQSGFWRVIARVAAVVSGVTLLWVGLFDDWLQLVAEPYRLSLKWDYQRVVYDPVSSDVRMASVGLIAAMLACLAMLFARHVGAYLLQIGTLLIGLMLWIQLYIMNQRLNLMIAEGAEASNGLLETLGLTMFWALRAGIGIATIIVTLIPAMMAFALVATLLLDLLNKREPPITHEAEGFFSELGRRADQREDIPLSRFWKPLRRPL